MLFLAGLMLFATTCFGIFGLEKGIPADLQPLVFFTPLLFIGAGVLVSMAAFVAGLVRAFTRTTPAGDSPVDPLPPAWPVADAAVDAVPPPMPVPLRPAEAVAPGRPTFAQALGIATAGCVLFLSLCAGIVGGGNSGRAGWIAGPILFVLIGAALYGYGVMVLRVVQAFGGPRR